MGTKISALPAGSALAGTEKIPMVQSGADAGVTPTQIRTFVLASVAAVALSGSAADLVAGTLAAGRLPALSGDISSAAGSAVTAIGANKVTRAMLFGTSGAAILGATGAGNVSDLTAAQVKTILALTPADLTKTVSTQAGTAYSAVIGDGDAYTQFTAGSAVTFTIPANATVAFPIGTEITFEQGGAGVVTVSAAGGVTIHSRGGLLSTAGQYAVAGIKKIGTNTWTLYGDLA